MDRCRPTIPDPNDTSDDAVFAFTSTITITEGGFEPCSKAVAVFGDTLTFVNETAREQTITFINASPTIDGPTTLGPIAPGAAMDYTEELGSAISVVYESDGMPGHTGQLQINPGILDEL